MATVATGHEESDTVAPTPRFRAWPLWAAGSGALGFFCTVVTDTRAGDTSDPDYMVTVADMAALDHVWFRVGGIAGYFAVAAILVFAALWHRRVAQRFTWSLGAPIVTYGFIASAAALSLAYGWKGALGDYLHGAAEEGTFDDQGLYVYYVMHDFSPYIGWVPVTVGLLGLAWMAFRERLVSRALGGVAGFFALLLLGAVAVTGVPGLPFASSLVLVVVGTWLAVGRSPITREALV
ncbi:hypothetical protein [Nocardioides sp. SYSU D00038]|uniref:hypothetical protein n=1 Tax=Nocardioides sp. SYSU D00038 TaxID=2812554 RepID=UPI001968468B|nr:hypothetical protein [Nocardioides sp. SYSU D00038]